MNKKNIKYIMFFLTICCFITFAYASTTTYMGCGDTKGIPNGLPGLIRALINIIKIGVPILMILMGSIDFGKAVIGDEKELSRATKKFTTRCLGGVGVYFIVFLVQLLLKLVGSSSDGMIECITCFTSDGSYCYSYEVENEDYSEEAAQAKKEREELEAKREEVRKKNEEETKKQEQQQQQQQEQEISGSIPSGGSRSVENAIGLPYYNQCDPRWKNIQYDIGGGSNGGPATLCSSSCGYTSLSMVVAGLTKDSSINPYTIVKFLRNINDGELTRRGYGAASTSELTSSTLITKYGIKGTNISASNIESSLRAGKPVVILIPGHYMTLSISESGKIVLLDPFTNWADSRRRVGEFNSLSEITRIYGNVQWAAAYEKV